MYAVEFQTHITDGIIEVPESYRGQLSGSVRVIILADTTTTSISDAKTHTPATNLVTHLLAHPRRIAGFAPLKRDELYERG